ncbi:pentatricopeptide repeat-containing protein At3g04130, mitochondrial-like [Impatiens glandulifera]|uniref:pentatricopeptide repeat-containing protein At3g04130, mitochondrial-like n=1 Tax=Impatiens glandulifera TaxID=253017 RepID=UPI001FB066FB|nr:pentatricopeptide repeat-containing protein At3g04130, mitochondrial-like [Impatiens glandulifera]
MLSAQTILIPKASSRLTLLGGLQKSSIFMALHARNRCLRKFIVSSFRPTSMFHHDASSNSSDRFILNKIMTKSLPTNSVDEIFKSLSHDQTCKSLPISDHVMDTILYRYRDDWKSALGIFKWVRSLPHYKPSQKLYDIMIDILGKAKSFDSMKELLEEMRQDNNVTLHTIAKVMRRLSGAGKWEDAVKVFDELTTFGLEKNTESMNLLLDTLCKEERIDEARSVFLQLKPNIVPNAYTFNIFIHGWCKVNRVDEAHWTIQEMKGYGYPPCVISYSIIIQSYCLIKNFYKAYETLKEMKDQGCPPNIITYTTIMSLLVKSEEYEEALRIADEARRTDECKPDTLFYNVLIIALGKANRLEEAVNVFKVEMMKTKAKPSTSTFNSMIMIFCHNKLEEKALEVLGELEDSAFCRPDAQSFYPLIKLCLRNRKLDLLRILLDKMVNKHLIGFNLATYTLLIHGLCRADECEWAYQLFEEMISKDIMPSQLTFQFLLDEIKQRTHMYDAAERIEVFMKQK